MTRIDSGPFTIEARYWQSEEAKKAAKVIQLILTPHIFLGSGVMQGRIEKT